MNERPEVQAGPEPVLPMVRESPANPLLSFLGDWRTLTGIGCAAAAAILLFWPKR